MDNQSKGTSTPAQERLYKESPCIGIRDAIDSEMIKRVELRLIKGASSRTLLKGTAQQPQPLGEKKTKRQGEFTELKTVNSSSDSDSDYNDDGNNYTKGGSLQTHKRRQSSLADTVTRKPYSQVLNTMSKERLERAARYARRQKLSPFCSIPLSSDNVGSDNSSNESDEESGNCRRRL
ncbi:hypothetical protein CC78DRAFT_591515 [Lojkania enalia]|uniref:Uncharacterized protein n=1 Tax=Lojkania enalia TaxID=147567 RepID=A0A9P4JYU4_9PLEO|nr:hypothetical protein CC78DRAFT_591515 [Didymosphaeria enalia]